MNNGTAKYITTSLPKEMVREKSEDIYRKIRRYRALHIQTSVPPIVNIKSEEEEHKILF
jgi:hypothetical protein